MPGEIAIGSDHGGFLLKEAIKNALKKSGYKVEDEGAFSVEACDYPKTGAAVAKKVSAGKVSRGILICKSGIGMGMVANKFPGVRAGVCNSAADAESSRQHNDANLLVLAANKVGKKKAAEIVKVWLETKALKGRHARRVRQIKALEKKVFKKR